MKIFLVFILAFLVFSEAVFPCCIWDNCAQEEMIGCHDNEDENKEAGGCSPFAACSACVTGIVIPKPFTVILSEVAEIKAIQNPAPYHFILSSYNNALLQPPKAA